MDALNDAGNRDTGLSGVSGEFDIGEQANLDKDTSEIESNVDGTVDAVEDTKTTLEEGLSTDRALNLPGALGGCSLDFDVTLPVLGAMTVTLAPFSTWITLFRNLALFAMYIMFWFATARVVRQGIA